MHLTITRLEPGAGIDAAVGPTASAALADFYSCTAQSGSECVGLSDRTATHEAYAAGAQSLVVIGIVLLAVSLPFFLLTTRKSALREVAPIAAVGGAIVAAADAVTDAIEDATEAITGDRAAQAEAPSPV